MKIKVLNSVVISVLLISSMFLVTACDTDKEEVPIINPIEITLSINYPEASTLDDIEAVPFKIEEDSTVLDALQLYCNVNELPITVEMTDGSVDGINTVNNGDFYKKRTWQYKLNEQLSSTPENQQTLKDGDSIDWVYAK